MPEPRLKNIRTSGPGDRSPRQDRPKGDASSAPDRTPLEELAREYDQIRRAMDEEPQVIGHRLLLGDICLRMGRKQEAKEILVKSIELAPRFRENALALLRTVMSEEEIARLPLREVRAPFYSDAARVISYPLRGNGPVLLIGGGIIFAGLDFLAKIATVFFWVPLLIILGYLASYMMTIIESSGRGSRNPPDYPDFTNIWDSILGPFWMACCASLIPLVPPFIWWIEFGLNVGLLPFIALGLVYWPMALIAGAFFQNALAPLNAILVLRGIRVTAGEYFPAVVAIYGLAFANWLVSWLTKEILPDVMSMLIVETVCLYFMMVEMHILGGIYYNHESALGWFARGERRPGPPASPPPPARTEIPGKASVARQR